MLSSLVRLRGRCVDRCGLWIWVDELEFVALRSWLVLDVALVALEAQVRLRLWSGAVVDQVFVVVEHVVREHVVGINFVGQNGRGLVLEVELLRQDLVEVLLLFSCLVDVVRALELRQEIVVADLVCQGNLTLNELRELESVRQHLV